MLGKAGFLKINGLRFERSSILCESLDGADELKRFLVPLGLDQ
jgi:hypothetical protein